MLSNTSGLDSMFSIRAMDRNIVGRQFEICASVKFPDSTKIRGSGGTQTDRHEPA